MASAGEPAEVDPVEEPQDGPQHAAGGRGWQAYAKAIAAFITAGLTSTYAALADDSAGGAVITAQEGVGIALAVVAVTGVVWGVPNKGR